MAPSIVPLSAIPPALLVDLLEPRGEPKSLIDWKYFDRAFAPGRERGYVWLKNDAVAGFIGLIPFDLGRDGDRWECAWTCDWMLADPKASPGMGIKLFRTAIQAHQHVATFLGNQNTKSLVPRMATRTIEQAAVRMFAPLKMGPILERISNRLPGPLRGTRLESWPILSSLPAPRISGLSKTDVRVEPNVSPALRALLEGPIASSWYPRYDYAYVDWQLGRCPVLDVATLMVGPAADPDAAAVWWWSPGGPKEHRFAMWARVDAEDRLGDIISESVRQAAAGGAEVISTIVSKTDVAATEALRRAGFLAANDETPLYTFSPRADSEPFDNLDLLSYLATDLAYRY